MYAIVVRIFSIALWLGLLVGFMAGYLYVRIPMGPDGPFWPPLLGGLVGLFVAIMILGAGFTLAGIYENTLATARALQRMSGQTSGAQRGIGPAQSNSDEALEQALPLHAGHWIFIALLVAFFIWMIYFIVQRYGPTPTPNQSAVESPVTEDSNEPVIGPDGEPAPPEIGPDGLPIAPRN